MSAIPITYVDDVSTIATIDGVRVGVRYSHRSDVTTPLHVWGWSLTLPHRTFAMTNLITSERVTPLAALGLLLGRLLDPRNVTAPSLSIWTAEHEADLRSLHHALTTYVALVFSEGADTVPFDWTMNWESAQNYAKHGGHRVVAIRGDGHLSADELQRLLNHERDLYLDCFRSLP